MITPEIVARIGRMLHGAEWVAPLARDLELNVRSFQRMMAGDRPIPDGLARPLLALIDARRAEIARALGLENHPQERGVATHPQERRPRDVQNV